LYSKGVPWDKWYCNNNINKTYHLVNTEIMNIHVQVPVLLSWKKKRFEREKYNGIQIIYLKINLVHNYSLSICLSWNKMLVLIKQIQNNAIYTSGQILLQKILWTNLKKYICQAFVHAKNAQHLLCSIYNFTLFNSFKKKFWIYPFPCSNFLF